MSPTKLYFSTQGRIGRATWWLGTLGMIAIAVVVISALWLGFSTRMVYTFPGRLTAFFVNIVLLVMTYCLAVKRFNDRDRPAILPQIVVGIYFVKMVLDLFLLTGDPWGQNIVDYIYQAYSVVVGVWYLIELGCLRGTIGANRHGEDPVVFAPSQQR